MNNNKHDSQLRKLKLQRSKPIKTSTHTAHCTGIHVAKNHIIERFTKTV